MKNTIKFDNKSTRVVAHRGLSGLERENTAAAFVAAGNRSYFGIETDIHRTSDGKFAAIHDSTLNRVAGRPVTVESTPLDLVQEVVLYDMDGTWDRHDLCVPTLENYISICKKYGKHCVLELKNDFSDEEIAAIISIIEKQEYLSEVTFIAFGFENLVRVRAQRPDQSCQFLTGSCSDETIEMLKEHKIDLDVYHEALTEERVKTIHDAGIVINCYTVDNPDRAAELAAWGVDQITSNILEGIR